MIRVVLDTNVVVSAHLSAAGFEERVFKLLLLRRVAQLYLSQPILEEYERVLTSPRLSLPRLRVRASLAHIRHAAHVLEPMHALAACPHGADNRFLECAEAARADFLITGNKRHFPKRFKQTQVVNAREFMDLIISRKF